MQAFVESVVEELAPVGARETEEASAIAALYVGRRRLVELESLALAGETRASLLAPEALDGSPRVTYEEQERAASQALNSELLQNLPRYEAHMSRELGLDGVVGAAELPSTLATSGLPRRTRGSDTDPPAPPSLAR